MSGRIDAGIRLFHVAADAVSATRGHLDELERVVIDPSIANDAKRTQAMAALNAGLAQATEGAIAAAAGAKVAAGDTAAARATNATQDAVRAVAELRAKIEGIATAAPGEASGNTNDLRGAADAAQSKVEAARTAIENSGAVTAEADDALFRQTADELKARNLPFATNEGVDAVIAKAKAKPTEFDAEGAESPLAKYAVDMVQEARAGKYDALVGREHEVDQVLSILKRSKKRNPVLLGDAGVGKTQIVEGLAKRVADEQMPASLRDLKIYAIDAGDLQAASGGQPGELAKIVKEIVTDVKRRRANGENVTLFMDEMHTLMNLGDTAQQLKPSMARGEISLIGATTWDEFNKFVSKDDALVRRLAKVSVEELEKPQVLDVLRSAQEGLSKHHGVVIYDSAVKEAQRVAAQYVKDRKQPDPAIELLDHSMSRVSKLWTGGVPEHVEKLQQESDRLTRTIPRLEQQVVIGDTRAAGQLVGMRERLAEIAPKLESLTTQLQREREVLGARHDLVDQYLAKMGAGETGAAEALVPQLTRANEAVAALRTEYPERLLTDIVDDIAVREAASELYNRTISAGGAEDAKRLLELPDRLAGRVIGQDHVTSLIASSIQRAQSGMKRPNAPAGAFLLTGPTGVGKTETVRAVAEELTGDVKNMIRIDMGEFSEPHSISKLFGSPPGYVGYGETPRLGELVKNPEAHVIFDEVEKAHPSIFQKLLALFEEGRATLGDGTPVDATGATLYMTSNLPDELVRQHFSPEFLNRLNAVVRFNHLSKDNVTTILDKLLLPKTLEQAKANGLAVELTEAAKSRVVDYGYDRAMGARPLQRSIDNHVSEPASDMILKLRAEGRVLDPAAPERAVLDVDPGGDGFVMRSADGAVSVPVEARPASEHAPGAPVATHGGSAPASAPAPQTADPLDGIDFSFPETQPAPIR